MRIYIDEAVKFVIPQKPSSSFSLVLALIIPSAGEADLFFEFLHLRDSWPEQKIEIKGSTLNETQAAQVVDLLARFDVVTEFIAVDMGTQAVAVINDLKSRQADAVTEHLTSEHHPGMVEELQKMSRQIRRMSDQLFVQAFLTIELVLRVVQVATLYYVQRVPAELGDIAWFIDRKQRSVTEMEEVWSSLILPVSEHRYATTPFIALKGLDYSHFDSRYRVQLSDEAAKSHLEWMEKTYDRQEPLASEHVSDAKRILTEQQSFVDSLDSLGVQLADLLATILRRALNGHLQSPGWKEFGKLLVINQKNKSSFFTFGKGPSALQGHAAKVAKTLESKSKSMFPKEA
jgi:hypothetical protein